MNLSGRVALVTGASRGIGKAIAAGLYAAGAKVALVSRDEAKINAAASELGERAAGFAADVSNAEAVTKMIEAVEKSLGPIDILVNNAGVTRDGLLMRMSDGDWDTVVDTNLKAAFTTMKVVTRGMMKRRWGRVINIASVV